MAGAANGAQVRRWFHEEKAVWYAVLADPQMPVISALLDQAHNAIKRKLFARSCTPTLRIIPPIQKSDTMAPSDTIMRGRCDDSAPYLLPAGDCGTPVALRH